MKNITISIYNINANICDVNDITHGLINNDNLKNIIIYINNILNLIYKMVYFIYSIVNNLLIYQNYDIYQYYNTNDNIIIY